MTTSGGAGGGEPMTLVEKLEEAERRVREAQRETPHSSFIILSYEYDEEQNDYGWDVEMVYGHPNRLGNIAVWRPTLDHALATALDIKEPMNDDF